MAQISIAPCLPAFWCYGTSTSRTNDCGIKKHTRENERSKSSKAHNTTCLTTQQKHYAATNAINGAGGDLRAHGAEMDHIALTNVLKNMPSNARTMDQKLVNSGLI